ncbi:MAG: indolepyruvate ferredoxin oxidoreductase subunit alpha [Thermoplasmata archaeon]
MSYNYLYEDNIGKTYFILSNEAIVRGALESAVDIVATYPGTPTSEIGDIFSKIAKEAGVYFEFSTNESVALGVAAAASSSGLRALAFMKHVGLNVASDFMMTTAYIGARGGLVIITGDDPSMHSSQNEQDNRHYAELAHLPLIEPSSPQEALDYLKEAFEISESLKLPVLFRTTTRVNHLRGQVTFGSIRKNKKKSEFIKNPEALVPLPANAYKMRKNLEDKNRDAIAYSNRSVLNRIEEADSDIGAIASGAGYNVLKDVVSDKNINLKILKLGFTRPVPDALILKFIKSVKKLIIVEELDPYLEKEIRTLVQLNGLNIEIYGKLNGYFPAMYEYNADVVYAGLAKVLGIKVAEPQKFEPEIDIPARPPVLCPGCPHRATYYATKTALKQLRINNAIVSTDIGCYTLGIQKPYELADFLLAMGSSISAATGFAKATDQPVISFIGDSTFFHNGIPGLINAVHNKSNLLLIILDNRTTAMTGHQSNPGMPIDGMLQEAPELSIENIVKAVGVEFVKVVDPYDLKTMTKAIREGLEFPKTSVIIAKRECALLMDARNRKNSTWITYHINQDKCTKCMNCVSHFSCPAIFTENGKVYINATLCDGCGVCAEPLVCGFKAIEVAKNE